MVVGKGNLPKAFPGPYLPHTKQRRPEGIQRRATTSKPGGKKAAESSRIHKWLEKRSRARNAHQQRCLDGCLSSAGQVSRWWMRPRGRDVLAGQEHGGMSLPLLSATLDAKRVDYIYHSRLWPFFIWVCFQLHPCITLLLGAGNDHCPTSFCLIPMLTPFNGVDPRSSTVPRVVGAEPAESSLAASTLHRSECFGFNGMPSMHAGYFERVTC